MINSVTITNHLGESLELVLRHPERTGIIIQSIVGIGPAEATININESASIDGGTYNSSKLTPRNIVFNLAFGLVSDIESVRQKTYKYFPVKRKIRLVFETDNRKTEIYGFVEKNEPDIFQKLETTQISIMCTDPYFYALDNGGVSFAGVEAQFEFPFSNESLNVPLLSFGEITIGKEQNVVYQGDGEIGVVIRIHAIGPASGLRIYNTQTKEVMSFSSEKLISLTGADISYGDDITISTVRGDKYVRLLRDGVVINILNILDKDSDWFQLSNADNVLLYTLDEGDKNIQFRVEHRIAYEGV